MLRKQYPYVTVATYFLDVDHETEYEQGLFDANYNPKPPRARSRTSSEASAPQARRARQAKAQG